MEFLDRKEVFSLSVDAYYHKTSKPDKYTAEQREEGFTNYLKDLGKDFRKNQNEIFQIIEDTANEILPKKVLDSVKQFAEFQTFGENVTVKFNVKRGKIKAVAVALGGTVIRSRIDKGSYFVRTEAVQNKVYEEFERIISNQTNWTELINLVINSINDYILQKIYACLISLTSKVPTVNKHVEATNDAFDETSFKRIINIVKAYGSPVIIGTSQAVSAIPMNNANSQADMDDLRNNGFIGIYHGTPVVEIENSFEDKENTIPTLNDNFLFIIPSGQEKIIKCATEGGLHTRSVQEQDWSMSFETYQKVGVSVFEVNNIGIYQMA
jgi:hypothetical protein